MRGATDEPRRYAAVDGLAVAPAAGGALSLLGAVIALGARTLEAAGPEWNDLVVKVGLLSWFAAGTLGIIALMAALAQLVWVTANRRSAALPTTALLLSAAVLIGCLVMPVADAVAERYRPAPTISSTFSSFAVPMTAPWSAMKLPSNGGSTLYSDATTLTVVYSGAQGSPLAASYDQRIRALGWTPTQTMNTPGMWTHTYTLAGKSLTFAVIEDTNNAFTAVSLTQF